MPRIEAISVCTAVVPLERPISLANRVVHAREYLLVKVRSDAGLEGLGYTYAGNAGGRILANAVCDLLAPVVVGQDSTRVEGLWNSLYQEVLLHGRVGAVMRALSALDIAMWDLNARSAKLPLFRYLGCWAEDRVPAYASGGYYLTGKSLDTLSEEMAGYVADGFRAVKMKTGRLSAQEEEQRVAAAREAIGPDVLLMLDANCVWRDLPTALSYVRKFERHDPYWIEEPFLPDDIENHVRLAKATPVTVSTGETEAGRWRFKDLLDRGAASILQPDATVCGGITEYRRIAATASSYGVTISPHACHDLHVHLLASESNSSYVEFMPDDHVFNFRRLIDRQLTAEAGDLILPQGPGLGFNFSDEAVARYGLAQPGSRDVWQSIR